MTPPDRPVSARLEELRALREAGTSGEWFVDGNEEVSSRHAEPLRQNPWPVIADNEGLRTAVAPEDAALIVAAVNALPALLDIAEAAEDTIGRHEGCFGEEHLADCPFGRLESALDRLNTEDGA